MIASLYGAGKSLRASNQSRSLWWSIPLWVGAGTLLLTIANFGMERTEKHLLAQDAEQTALKYAEFIARTVPDLEHLFTRRELSEQAQIELQRSSQLGDVFRFKLFDANGQLLLTSDQIVSMAPLSAAGTSQLGSHHGDTNSYVSDIVLGGKNYIELSDGRKKPDRPDLYSEAYVPLMGDNGIQGVIEVYVDQSARQRLIAAAFTEVALIAATLLLLGGTGLGWQTWQRSSDRRQGEERIRYLAEHDVLSGALNRASFQSVLISAAQAATASGESFAIHCIDLDRFKEINDTQGHATGDQVLCEVADRLTALHRPGDVLARLGGDEFAILQATQSDPRDVESYGQLIVKSLASPIEIDGSRIPCGASVGAACFGTDATEISDLLHKADLAMYRSKTSGRGRFSFYDETLDHELEERRLLAIDLRTALADRTLCLHYQPLFEAEDRDTATGFEALMRWNHPTRGNVPPSIFIPLAEECGEIEALGTWAIEQACNDATLWKDCARVAVNLSAAQFRAEATDVVSVVSHALEKTGLAPERLELEITESLLISNPEQVLDSLNRLSNLGVRIAMDDFGTGYSSLAYLWRFPFNKVKIDRAFVKELEDEGKVSLIIGSIVSLAHSLGMRVNAEGVETELQRDALRQLGCDELQGFLLGRPAPNESHEPHVDIDRRAA
ncbi:putative signaling protein [Granulosicoccus antarcticus IMCC3135]|uniref:Putative signaling protein n=2 Tax=Granulosicoccus TaxID=437504 RepID=A0A2Z2P8Z6_9GAMM|nr:putative signaling protein [Granulosicoccus antarcticus IMCC3135]